MTDEEQQSEEEREPLKRYRVQLDGNRGEAVMKLNKKDAEAMGDRVLGPADSEQPDHTTPGDDEKFSDGTATKAKTPPNKAKPAAKNK